LIRQTKLARFERLSLAAGLEAERQGLEQFLANCDYEEVPDSSPEEVERNLYLVRDPKDVPIVLAAISAGVDYLVTNERPHCPRRDHGCPEAEDTAYDCRQVPERDHGLGG
jgi:hypothetical protein